MRKNRLKNYIKLGIVLFGISLISINCQTDQDQEEQLEENKSINAKTVSFEDAKNFFTSKEKEKRLAKGQNNKTGNELIISPNWNSLEHHDIYDMEPKLTLANVNINRPGNYTSKLFFIETNGKIKNAIFTVFKKDTTANGSIVNASIYFNKVNGEFIDGYEIEDGKFTKQYVVKRKLQQASFMFLFQNTDDCPWTAVGDCGGGDLEEVNLGTIRSGSDGGSSSGGGGGATNYSTIRNWNLSGNSGSEGGSRTRGGGGNSITAVAGNIYANSTETNEDGSEVDEEDKCANQGKVYNKATKKCECPEGKTEDKDGKCVDDDDDDDDCDTSKEDLKKVFTSISDANASILASIINDKGQDFGIESDEDLWHFLSQAGHETGGFKKLNVTESTYWTTANKLANTYKKFTMDSIKAKKDNNFYYAPDYLKNSSGVANIAMCCKYGNGDVKSGDGYKYRGRGLFQLTWKDNYKAFKTWYNNKYDPDIDPVSSPNIIATNDTLAVLSGLWYYKTRVADKITIDSTTSVSKVTKPINPAKKGLADRKQRFQKAKDSINCL